MRDEERSQVFPWFLILGGLAGAVYFWFFHDVGRQVSVESSGRVVNLGQMYFGLCGLLVSLALEIIGAIALVGVWIENAVNKQKQVRPL